MTSFLTMDKRTAVSPLVTLFQWSAMSKKKTVTYEISCRINGKSRACLTMGVCSLNLMLWCCNTHPVANQESFHKSQGQLQQQLTIRNVTSFSFLGLSLASFIVYYRATSTKRLLLHLFVRVFLVRSTQIFALSLNFGYLRFRPPSRIL